MFRKWKYIFKNDILGVEKNWGDIEEKIEVNFDKVKNSVIDNIMSIVYNLYLRLDLANA